MKLQRVTFKNIHPFKQFTLDLEQSSTASSAVVILGAQQSGKTAFLKHTFNALNWFACRHKDIRSSGVLLADHEMLEQASFSSINLQVSYPQELGNVIADSHATPQQQNICHWRIEKQRPQKGLLPAPQSDLQHLDLLIQRYQQQTLKDPLFSTPCLAYYPIERFIYEVNIQGKNATSTLSPIHNAYDLLNVSFTTFSKFFEWFREVHDLENAQAAKLFKQYLDPSFRFELQQNLDETFSTIEQAYRLSSQRCISSLRSALRIVMPEIQDIHLEYTPKLAMLIQQNEQAIPFLQLPQATRIWIGLVGDLVRRLSLLNPNSLYPCLEGEGIILIDQIDLLLDQTHLQHILPRLQRAFPRLQFIVSSLNPDVVENTPLAQCFQLQGHKFYPLQLNDHQQQLQQIYQVQPTPIIEENTHTSTSHTEDLLAYFQTLDQQQKAELLEQLNALQQLKEN